MNPGLLFIYLCIFRLGSWMGQKMLQVKNHITTYPAFKWVNWTYSKGWIMWMHTREFQMQGNVKFWLNSVNRKETRVTFWFKRRRRNKTRNRFCAKHYWWCYCRTVTHQKSLINNVWLTDEAQFFTWREKKIEYFKFQTSVARLTLGLGFMLEDISGNTWPPEEH